MLVMPRGSGEFRANELSAQWSLKGSDSDLVAKVP